MGIALECFFLEIEQKMVLAFLRFGFEDNPVLRLGFEQIAANLTEVPTFRCKASKATLAPIPALMVRRSGTVPPAVPKGNLAAIIVPDLHLAPWLRKNVSVKPT